jgi:xylulokinase
VISADYRCDRAFRTLIAPIPGYYFAEHILRGGVFTIGWFVEQFAADLRGLPDAVGQPQRAEDILEAAARQLPPGAAGLMLVPYWNNVMNPYWDPAATGVVIGWTGSHGRAHFYRAILEGIAYEQRLVGDAMMAALGAPFTEYVVMGGGSRSDLWCQIISDITGVPVVRSTSAEATCLGAGILAATAAGWYADVSAAAAAMTSVAGRFTPQPAHQAIYDRLYRTVYRDLFPAVQPAVDRLTALTAEIGAGMARATFDASIEKEVTDE